MPHLDMGPPRNVGGNWNLRHLVFGRKEKGRALQDPKVLSSDRID